MAIMTHDATEIKAGLPAILEALDDGNRVLDRRVLRSAAELERLNRQFAALDPEVFGVLRWRIDPPSEAVADPDPSAEDLEGYARWSGSIDEMAPGPESRLDEPLGECPYCGEAVCNGQATVPSGGRLLHAGCLAAAMAPEEEPACSRPC